MPAFRFTLRSLGFAVAIVSLVCGVLVGYSYCLTLLTLVVIGLHLTAIIGVVYRSDSNRAFWIGFAIFGWTYMLIAFAPDSINSKLFEPTGVLGPIYGQLRRTAPIDATTRGRSWGDEVYEQEGAGYGSKMVRVVVTGAMVHRTYHLLLSLVFALVGGFVGQSFYRKSAIVR